MQAVCGTTTLLGKGDAALSCCIPLADGVFTGTIIRSILTTPSKRIAVLSLNIYFDR